MRSRPQRREAGELGVEAAGSLRLSSGHDRRALNPDGPCAPLAIRVPSAAAAAAAAKADGTRAPEKEQTEAAPQLGEEMTFPLTPAPPSRARGGAPWSPGGAQAASHSAPRPTGTGPSACHKATGPLGGGSIIETSTNRGPCRGGASPNVPPPPRPGLAPIRRQQLSCAATVSLSVERRGSARVCGLRGGALGGSARFLELSLAEESGGGRIQGNTCAHTGFKGREEREADRQSDCELCGRDF